MLGVDTRGRSSSVNQHLTLSIFPCTQQSGVKLIHIFTFAAHAYPLFGVDTRFVAEMESCKDNNRR